MPKSRCLSRLGQSESGTRFVYLALGSNIRPRKRYLLKSVQALADNYPNCFRVSGCYVTRPYMGLDQPGYFNCCVSFETPDSALDVLGLIKQIEKQQGRERSDIKWGSRTIDIDILFFGDELIDQPELIIPHYDISHRDFFLVPMLELQDTFVNPRSGMLLSDELESIPIESRTNPKLIETRRECALNQKYGRLSS